MFKKLDVNGENEHPLYTFLKNSCPTTRDEFASSGNLFYTPIRNDDIRWNFEKFLIDQRGRPVARYDPSTEPYVIAKDIQHLLSQMPTSVSQLRVYGNKK